MQDLEELRVVEQVHDTSATVDVQELSSSAVGTDSDSFNDVVIDTLQELRVGHHTSWHWGATLSGEGSLRSSKVEGDGGGQELLLHVLEKLGVVLHMTVELLDRVQDGLRSVLDRFVHVVLHKLLALFDGLDIEGNLFFGVGLGYSFRLDLSGSRESCELIRKVVKLVSLDVRLGGLMSGGGCQALVHVTLSNHVILNIESGWSDIGLGVHNRSD